MPMGTALDGAVIPEQQHAIRAQVESQLDGAQTTVVLPVFFMPVQPVLGYRLPCTAPVLRRLRYQRVIGVPPRQVARVEMIAPRGKLPRAVNGNSGKSGGTNQFAIVRVEAGPGRYADEGVREAQP